MKHTFLPPGLEVFNELEEPKLERKLLQISESAKLVAAQLEVPDTIYPIRGKGISKRLSGQTVGLL